MAHKSFPAFELLTFDTFFQEIASLAAKILRTALAGSYLSEEKRNAGTIDSLYNLPHLFAAGRR